MKLFLLRHGPAGTQNLSKYPNDAARPLTKPGKRQVLAAAKYLRAQKVRFSRIISSPLRRARQTAEIVSEVYGQNIALTDDLAPDGDMRQVIRSLARIKGDNRSILLVGHEPYMTTLISVLVSGHDDLQIRLKKGGLCRLNIETLRYGRCARLDWLLTPKHLQD